jgi:ABC-type xylose transport system substrate-binding protein
MAREYNTLTEENFIGEHPLCSYVQAYLKSEDLTIGDEWNTVEYMRWIEDKQAAFRKLYKIPEHITYNQSQNEIFLEFIGYTNY